MRFSKYQALGNDFIILNRMSENWEVPDVDVTALCHRRTGVGADGLLYLLPSQKADLRMRIFNADGSEAEMCGNGIRALALFALHQKVVNGESMTVETQVGVKEVRVLDIGKSSGRLMVNMGRASLLSKDIPLKGIVEDEALDVELSCGGKSYLVTCVSMGNPHCVYFVEDLHSVDIEKEGNCLENHKLFPQRTNVEFVQVEAADKLSVRVWERGVGETLACGTGAGASVVAGYRNGKCERVAKVRLPGGELSVEIAEKGEIYLTGEIRRVFEGNI